MYKSACIMVALCIPVLLQCDKGISAPGDDMVSHPVHIRLSPSSDSCFFQGDTITFSIEFLGDSIASSRHDGIVWTSDKDGHIGNGIEVHTHTLSIDTHTIVTTFPYKGNAIKESVRIQVRAYDSVNVYMVGGNGNRGVYWVNGNMYVTDAGNRLRSLQVYNNDIYFLGGGKGCEVCYMKNNVKHELEGKAARVWASDLCVNDNGVYVVGGEITADYDPDSTSGSRRGVYWYNGQRKVFTDSGVGDAIYVYNDDIYIAGNDNNICTQIWKNGNVIFRHDSPYKMGDNLSLVVHEDDIYLSGNTYVTITDMVYMCGFYWHNGTTHMLSHDTTGEIPIPYSSIRLSSFFVDGSDVYACGDAYEWRPVRYVWKNGAPIQRFDTRGDESSACSAVFVHHGHLFIAGAVFDENGDPTLCYWRNGVRTDVPGHEDGYDIFEIWVTDR